MRRLDMYIYYRGSTQTALAVFANIGFQKSRQFQKWDSASFISTIPQDSPHGIPSSHVPDIDETLKQWRKEARDKDESLEKGLRCLSIDYELDVNEWDLWIFME